jgi:3-isopropylmalate dehydratase small subunit
MNSARVWVFGDDVDTDQIIPSQHLLLATVAEMSRFTFEPVMVGFADACRPGDVIVAGRNFGCGSSREQAPRVLRHLGVAAVVAGSFARIFFRNAINIGLPLFICAEAAGLLNTGDAVGLDMEGGRLEAAGRTLEFKTFPGHIRAVIDAGGLIARINQTMKQQGGAACP